MNHQRARMLLPAYADRELGRLRRFLLRRHYETCPACLAELESLQAMRTALRTNLTAHRAPPGLASRIGSALPREAPPPPLRPLRLDPSRLLGFGGSTLAGALAGVALTLFVTRQPDPLTAEAVANHVRSLMADHLTDVASSDRHTVKPWLSARLDLAPVVKDLKADGFPLLGGRLDYLEGHRAAAMVYGRDRHIINLFAIAAPDSPDSPPRLRTREGFNVVTWRMGGVGYVAVSDVEAEQLMQFVRLMRE